MAYKQREQKFSWRPPSIKKGVAYKTNKLPKPNENV